MKNRKPIVFSSDSGIAFFDGENGIKLIFEIIKNLIVLFLIGIIATFVGLYANRVIPYIINETLTASLFLDLITMPLPGSDMVTSSLVASVLFGTIFYSPYFFKLNFAHASSFTRFMGGIAFILFFDLYIWNSTPLDLLGPEFFNTQRQMTVISQSLIVILMAIFTSFFNKLTTKTSIIQIPEFGSEAIRKTIRKVWFYLVSIGLIGFVIKFSNRYAIKQDNVPINEWFNGLDFININYATAVSACAAIIVASVFYWPREDNISRHEKVIRFFIVCGCGWFFLMLYPLYAQSQDFINTIVISGSSTLLLAFILRSVI